MYVGATDTPEFHDQDTAEQWLREHWEELVESGVDEVALLYGDDIVYTMSLDTP